MANAISVTQVNNYIKGIFDAELMLQNIFVYGEIGNYKVTNGIAYFNLKDENALISCVLFGADKFPLFEVGTQVLVRGSVNYYAKGGKLNFNAYSIEQYGIGVLYQKFLELKEELDNLGYFNKDRKKPLPERVKRIGVVTSEGGAVIRDIIDVTHRRNDGVDIVLYPVKVQGLGAEKEIASGIDFFSNYDKVDVIIVARGGGSLEDLQPYNTRIVADAVFRCNKPIVSAVGHETDYTIIDFVSDLRAPTPSAAAELVVYRKIDDINMLYSMANTLANIINGRINSCLKEISYINEKVNNSYEFNFRNKVSFLNKSLSELERKIVDKINKSMQAINDLKIQLKANDIKSIIDKGFTRVFVNGNILKSIKEVQNNDNIKLALKDGVVEAKVTNKEKYDGI